MLMTRESHVQNVVVEADQHLGWLTVLGGFP